jgi:DnaJ-class molecular chaperone
VSWQICPACNGNGSHVNPAIDAGGISSQEFADDPDFAEAYMSGMYDLPCEKCNGSGKITDEQATAIHAAADDRRLAALEDGDFESYATAGDPRW